MCRELIFSVSPILVLAGNAMAQIDTATVTTGPVYLFENVSGGQEDNLTSIQSVNSRKHAYDENGSTCVLIPLVVQSPLSVDIRLAVSHTDDMVAQITGVPQHVIRTTVASVSSPAGQTRRGGLRHSAGAACGRSLRSSPRSGARHEAN